jgi:hypothetical protein
MPQLRAGLNQARASIRSEHSLKDCLPPRVAGAVRSVHSSGSALVICVTSTEAAHLVRLLRPEIERALADKGLKFNEISIDVQSETVVRKAYRRPLAPTVALQMQLDAAKIKSERLQTSLARLTKTLKS